MAKDTLYVTDFDDTLAQTDAVVYVTKADGTRVAMDPADYAVYSAEPGDEFDFSEFEQLKNPRPIQRFVKLLKGMLDRGVGKAVVLTARGHTLPVAQFLRSQGITSGVTIAALGSSNPQKKADYIQKQIDSDRYRRVLFVDDSPKNVAAVEQLRGKNPSVRMVIHQAKDHADPTPTQSSQQKKPSPTAQQNDVAAQAQRLGLEYYGFGKYGKDGTVTHISQNGRLVPKPRTT